MATLTPNWTHPTRILLGLFLILIAPGYTLTSLLFPKTTDITPTERLALTLGLSIAIIPLLGLILNYTPYGIHLTPITITLLIYLLITSSLILYRRQHTPPQETFHINPTSKTTRQNTLLTLTLILSLTGIIALANTLRPQETFTEFYILGPNGKLENYPQTLKPNQPYTLTFGVTNHENEPKDYRIITTHDQDLTVIPITLNPQETWQKPITLTAPTTPGPTKIPYDLYVNNQPGPYRTLHLFVNITN